MRIKLLILVITFAFGCRKEEDARIIGVKIYEHQGSFEALCSQWNELGINAAFSSIAGRWLKKQKRSF